MSGRTHRHWRSSAVDECRLAARRARATISSSSSSSRTVLQQDEAVAVCRRPHSHRRRRCRRPPAGAAPSRTAATSATRRRTSTAPASRPTRPPLTLRYTRSRSSFSRSVRRHLSQSRNDFHFFVFPATRSLYYNDK